MFDLSRIQPYMDNHGYITNPSTHEEVEIKNLFATVVSSVERFQHLGIRKGARLIFNVAAPFEDGKLSCFADLSIPKKPKLQLSTSAVDGCEYVGQLLCYINRYD